MSGDYSGAQIVGMDLRRHRSVLVRMGGRGQAPGHGPDRQMTHSVLWAEFARAGDRPKVVLEATYGWYWAADALAKAGAEVHLVHPLGVKAFSYRRVKNDEKDGI